jgi:hypothetical protein
MASWKLPNGRGANLETLRPSMDQETADVLATHVQAQAFERRRDDYSDHGLVICAPDGTPHDPDSASRRFQALVASCAPLMAIRLHDCVNAVLFGQIDTPIPRAVFDLNPGALEKRSVHWPMGRFVRWRRWLQRSPSSAMIRVSSPRLRCPRCRCSCLRRSRRDHSRSPCRRPDPRSLAAPYARGRWCESQPSIR